MGPFHWPLDLLPKPAWPQAKHRRRTGLASAPPLFQQHRQSRFSQTNPSGCPLCLGVRRKRNPAQRQSSPPTSRTAGGASADALRFKSQMVQRRRNRHSERGTKQAIGAVRLMGAGFDAPPPALSIAATGLPVTPCLCYWAIRHQLSRTCKVMGFTQRFLALANYLLVPGIAFTRSQLALARLVDTGLRQSCGSRNFAHGDTMRLGPCRPVLITWGSRSLG